MIEGDDRRSERQCFGDAEPRFLMNGWMNQHPRANHRRQQLATRYPTLETNPVCQPPSFGGALEAGLIMAVPEETQDGVLISHVPKATER